MSLVALFVLNILAISGILGVINAFASDKPTLRIDDYEFFNAANLTCTNFNISVDVFNVTNMKGCQVMVGYNASLLHAIRVYPTDITDDATDWIPVDADMRFHWDAHPTINNTRTYAPDYAYVWVGAWGFTLFSGNGSVFTIEFHIIKAPPRELVTEPENKSVSCALDLFIMYDDTVYPDEIELLDSTGDFIVHTVNDGLYSYTRPQIVITSPVAAFTWTPTVPCVNETVSFDASASTPNGGNIISYAWDFDGDGVVDKTEVAATTTWKYDTVGNYTVTLNVTDSEGMWNTTSHVVEVVMLPPVPLFVHPSVSTVELGETFQIGVIVNNVIDLYSFEFKLGYNTTILDAIEVWVMWPGFHIINETAGVVWVNASCPFPYPFSGNGTLAAITFNATGFGSCVLDLHGTTLVDFYAVPIAHEAVDGYAKVKLHDVAIVNVAPSAIGAYPGWDITFTFTVINEGTESETFWVAVYFNRTATEWMLIGNQTVIDLVAGAEKTLTFVLDTTDVPPYFVEGKYDIYTLNATASVLSREVDTEDNVLVDGAVELRFLGDVNGDGRASLADVGKVKLIISGMIKPPYYPPYIPDVNGNGIVSMGDVGKLRLIISGYL